jgi:leucyl aminopeptidase (aminopeptidase T)
MNESLLEQGVRKLVHVNGRVRPGERVVVVTDEPMVEIAGALTRHLVDAGADVVTCHMARRERDGQEPPSPVAAAMLEAQLIYSPVSISITHTRAMRAALEAGARAILMTAYTEYSRRRACSKPISKPRRRCVAAWERRSPRATTCG